MQINTNGQRNITLDFDAPKKFKLKKDGAEIPYIRTGKNSFRLGRNIDGVLDLEEVIEQPRIVKPMQLQAQQMALVNPNDVLMINQAAQQLEVEQNILGETQKRVEQTQAYLDIQQQRINESVLSVQGLETDNAERITATENGIFNLAGELAKAEGNSTDADNYIISELDEHKTAENPHGITKETIGLNRVDNTSDLDKPISKAVQSALDEKADKDEIQAIRDELGEYQEKNDRFTNALSNYTGGLGGNELPEGGLTGQVLVKRSDMSGDVEWANSVITIDDELSLESENPVQNKVITLAVNNISDEITAIESKIPTQASSSNQLADKDFVNSSIATNTATFRGTFNSVAELEAYSGEKDNNDYAFVTGVDSLGNTYYDRYKYNGVSWVYEYRLNNSSFTSAQWASINSGATTQSINQISTNTSNINSLQTSKQDVISDLATIRSGAALGATAVQPSDLNGYATESYVTTAVSGKQDTLVSGTNVKTINNASILGSGNIDIQGGSTYTAGIGIDITNDVISVTSDISTGAALGAIAVQPEDLSDYVTTNTVQTITSQKTFNGKISVKDVSNLMGTTILETYAGDTNVGTSNTTLVFKSNLTRPYFNNTSTQLALLSDVPTDTSDLTNGAGYITSSALTGYATESYVTTAVSGKQDTLVSGTGIDITNDVISVEGVKDQRNTSTAIKTWTGTRAQYDAIATKDSNTLYNITDDTDVSLTILEALYPVGSVYITTANTCPLSTLISGSTWVEETSRILVDKYVSGTDWWELYSDGWCRQGGVIQMSGSGVTKTLLKSYKDTNYNVLLTCGSNTTGWPIAWTNNPSKTNSSFYMDGTGNSGGAERTIQVNWEACGYTSTTTTYKRFRRTL